jgi:hypothetical protein
MEAEMFGPIRIAIYILVALFLLPNYILFYANLAHVEPGMRIFLALLCCALLYLVSMWIILYSLMWKTFGKWFERFQTVVSLVAVAVVHFINLYLWWKLHNGASLTASEDGYVKVVMASAVVAMIGLVLVGPPGAAKAGESKE